MRFLQSPGSRIPILIPSIHVRYLEAFEKYEYRVDRLTERGRERILFLLGRVIVEIQAWPM